MCILIKQKAIITSMKQFYLRQPYWIVYLFDDDYWQSTAISSTRRHVIHS